MSSTSSSSLAEAAAEAARILASSNPSTTSSSSFTGGLSLSMSSLVSASGEDDQHPVAAKLYADELEPVVVYKTVTPVKVVLSGTVPYNCTHVSVEASLFEGDLEIGSGEDLLTGNQKVVAVPQADHILDTEINFNKLKILYSSKGNTIQVRFSILALDEDAAVICHLSHGLSFDIATVSGMRKRDAVYAEVLWARLGGSSGGALNCNVLIPALSLYIQRRTETRLERPHTHLDLVFLRSVAHYFQSHFGKKRSNSANSSNSHAKRRKIDENTSTSSSSASSFTTSSSSTSSDFFGDDNGLAEDGDAHEHANPHEFDIDYKVYTSHLFPWYNQTIINIKKTKDLYVEKLPNGEPLMLGYVTRFQAEALLGRDSVKPGTFLVRFSVRMPQYLVVSYKDDHGNIQHNQHDPNEYTTANQRTKKHEKISQHPMAVELLGDERYKFFCPHVPKRTAFHIQPINEETLKAQSNYVYLEQLASG